MFKSLKWSIAVLAASTTVAACQAPTSPAVAPTGISFDAKSDSVAAIGGGGAIGSGN